MKYDRLNDAATLFRRVGQKILAGSKKFVVSENFKRGNINIIKLGDIFSTVFSGKIEEGVGGIELVADQLVRDSADKTVIEKVGIDIEINLANVYQLLLGFYEGRCDFLVRQGGRANVFFVRDQRRVLWAVYIIWNPVRRGWYVSARHVGGPEMWKEGDTFFFRRYD